VIALIGDVSKALKDCGGAASQYQHVQLQLRTLSKILDELERLEPNEDNLHHVNAIRHLALTCQFPLRDFMAKVDKYEKSLGPFSEQGSTRAAGRKAQWGVSMTKRVEELQVSLAGNILSLVLLMQTHEQ